MPRIDLKFIVKEIIADHKLSNQHDICRILIGQKNIPEEKVNQSKISRVLKQIGAVKVQNSAGNLIYALPKELPPPSRDTQLSDLVLSIRHNQNMVVVHTIPGAASLLARQLDYDSEALQILGTISGDDTIFVVPEEGVTMTDLSKNISTSL